MNENQNQRKPVNPWTIVGWLFVAFLILVGVGSCINAQHNCPSGTYWSSSSSSCQ